MVSIKDIANELHITPSTVSRALNGKKGVSKKLNDEILKKCNEMGYRRNAIAQSLITNRTYTIGVILSDITSRYYSYVVKGINTYLEEHGYSVMLCNTNRNKKTEDNYFDLLYSKRVDGLLIISITATENDLINFAKTGVPIVQVDNLISKRFSAVVNDNYLGASLLFEHMVSLGCRKIACLMGRTNNQTTIERLGGFYDVMKKHDIPVSDDQIIYIDSTFENAYKMTESLLKCNPDAIFGINDLVAFGALKYCLDHNIKVPNDLRLAGYDDIDIAEIIQVPLTTVHQSKNNLGKSAAKLLLQQIKHPDEPNQLITLMPRLVVRESCGEYLTEPPHRLLLDR